ncbi:uncharacterized protein LOC129718622 [Wyeomyia smithii]|uniref:uncharacterized protein LOC129718622 n=1 Tax=Wyeomyia smithii TaxID=174621 RepID=UPI002467F599|nr:uncharacterized protein LOC129718622 [Wyeomyia smithii]
MHEKWNLAKSILGTFPQLEGTRRMPEAPKESAFFWKNGGNLRGAHTGLIETRTNNMRKDLPREKRKFTRDKDLVIMAAVDDDIVEKAELCAAISAVTENVRRIGELMESTFYYHKYLLTTRATFSDIISVFPHLLSFEGDMEDEWAELQHKSEGPILICIAEIFKAGRYVIMIDETHHVEIATSEKAVEILK